MNQEYAYYIQKIIKFELDKILTLKKTKELLSSEDLVGIIKEIADSLKAIVKIKNTFRASASLKNTQVGGRISPHFETFINSSLEEILNLNKKIERIRIAHSLYNSYSKSNLFGACLILYGMIVKYGIREDEIRDFVDAEKNLKGGFKFDDVLMGKVPHDNLGLLVAVNHEVLKSKNKNSKKENLPIELIPKYNPLRKMAGFKYELKRTLLKNVKLRFRNEKDLNMVAFYLADSRKFNDAMRIVKLRFGSDEKQKIMLFLESNKLYYVDTNDPKSIINEIFPFII